MSALEELFDDANGDLAIGELESAVEKYRRCVELDPGFFDGWHALGMALMKTGRFPEAIEVGKKATELRPNDQIAWTSLSLFYNRNGDIKEAEAAGTKAKILSLGRGHFLECRQKPFHLGLRADRDAKVIWQGRKEPAHLHLLVLERGNER